MNRRTLLICGLFLIAFIPGLLRAESIVREGSPRVKLVNFAIQTEVIQGKYIQASAFFQLTAPIENDEKVFFHLVSPGETSPIVNIDFHPKFSTSRWVVGQTVEAGPAGIVIPFDIEPGEYDILLGLMEIIHTEDKIIYAREPYTNQDNFKVGTLKVLPATTEPEEGEKPAELVVVSFETPEDILLWEPVGCRVGLATLDETPAARVVVEPNPGIDYPGIELKNFFNIFPELSDWSEYDALEFKLGRGADSKVSRVIIQINDQAGRQFKQQFNFAQNLVEPIILDMIEVGGAIDISKISRIKFFLPQISSESSFLLADLKLVARGLGDGGPALTLSRVEAPATLKRGDVFFVKFYFSLQQPIFAPCQLFVHIYRENDLKGKISVTSDLPVPIRSWPLKEEVEVSSAPLMIRKDAPPGTYIIRAGLFTSISSSGQGYVKLASWDDDQGEKVLNIIQPVAGTDYIKQPYTNPEIQDWEVGKITVE